MRKTEKLSYSEFKKTVDYLRLYVNINCREPIAKLLHHIYFLEDKVKALELELRGYIQPELGTTPAAKKYFHATEPEKKKFVEKGERLYELCSNPELLDKYVNMMSGNVPGVKREQIISIANQWAKDNGKELLPLLTTERIMKG